MKLPLCLLLPTLVVLATVPLPADEPTAEALEATFKATMEAATMSGHWSPVKDGVLGAEKDDHYSIVGVEKVSGSSWVIKASMRGAVLPIPIEVKWAGDSAVIIVDHLQLPGGTGSYSARLLIHEHTYSGTWSGGDHGGLMMGIITNAAKTK